MSTKKKAVVKAAAKASAKKGGRGGKGDGALVLAGDVGGTRARFALFGRDGKTTVHQEVLGSREFDTFEGALARFLEGAKASGLSPSSIAAASFGIAGPVVGQRVKTTNLPWVIDATSIAREFGVPAVTLLNDLVAVGLGALAAPTSKIEPVHVGRPAKTGGNIAVIAAGTGLGEAVFVWNGEGHIPCPTEGAHVDFAPRTEVEEALRRVLHHEHGHVSYERVASGSTIHVLYNFFVKQQGVAETKAAAAHVLRAGDPNVAVVELAEKGESEAAMRAVELWCSVYGSEAANLALKSLATAGVYVCGGVSARLVKVLAHGLPGRRGKGGAGKGGAGKGGAVSPFVDAFRDKGRMRALVEKIPVAVVKEPLAGLLGAASHAAARAAGGR